MKREARAPVPGLRQATQFTCVAASITGALRAYGVEVAERDVNRILKASPGRGASWEETMGTLQYFGMRGELVIPATLGMLREWTANGIPVLIGWNPEGRPWSHASVVVEVDTEDNVHVMDPNCPDPDKTFRVMPKEDFYRKWFEEMGDIIVRRPALAVTPEITPDGRQIVAGKRTKLAFDDGQEAFSADEIAQALSMVRQAKHPKGKKMSEKEWREELPPELVDNVDEDALGLRNKSAHLSDMFDEPERPAARLASMPSRKSGRVRITERGQVPRTRPAQKSKKASMRQAAPKRRKLAAFAPTVETLLSGKVRFGEVYDIGTHLIVGGIQGKAGMRTASAILVKGYGRDRVSMNALEGQIIISKL